MLKIFGMGTALLLAGAIPAFAEDSCPVPPQPAVVDGSTATKDQVMAGIAAVKTYIAASDTYQGCLNDYINAAKAEADKNKQPLDPALVKLEEDKATASQNSKQTVGDAINTSIGAYKKAHPG